MNPNTINDDNPLVNSTDMKDGSGKLNVAKMASAFAHTCSTGGAFKVAVVRPESHVQKPTYLWKRRGRVVCLWMLNLNNRVCFLKVKIKRTIQKAENTISSGENNPNWTRRIFFVGTAADSEVLAWGFCETVI